ncbi:OmpA family protein [Candidatus Marifrigoribacter sp. Uisw_064]|jgi:outer membrane protein OmpA-like peptidoglycan-associated protein|uniref:OmpA family protein n=1 Tax=Candidatus Marifrigoribacter sp. Uisw_064 TaxID=3230970 RepID=UPI003AD8B4CC
MKKNILFVVFLFLVSFSASSQVEERYEIKHLTNVNTKYSDFGVSYFGENQVVFASSRKVRSLRNRTWRENSQPYLELYLGNIAENGEILDSELFSSEINTRYHEADVVFTSNLKTVYFTRNNYFERNYKKDDDGMNHLILLRAHIDEDCEWGNMEELTFNSDLYSVGHPTLSNDGKILYFVSDMPGGHGNTDIYFVHLSEDGTYGEPINAGPIVNTMSREMFPFLSESGVLYYSSDGKSGHGSLDVFKSTVSENGTVYTIPENLGSQINSPMDDFSFAINEETMTGYFSSNRGGGKGHDDIYYFKENPALVVCKQYANGLVRDKKSGALLPRAMVTLYKDGIEIEKVMTDDNARFAFTVECESNYKVVGTKEGYSEDSEEFITSVETELELDLTLDLKDEDIVEINGKDFIKIDPIYFDLNKSFIRPDASIELEKVIAVMKRYPQMIVQLGSHTDSRNTHKYNEALSGRRAASSLEYIISKGIERARIFGSGHGETQLVNGCSDGVKCSKDEHQQNRRTEFVVIRYNNGIK